MRQHSHYRAKRALVALLPLWLCASGCGGKILFGSATPLGFGVQGKTWRAPAFVDEQLFNPQAQAASTSARTFKGLVWDFSAASYGGAAQVIGSWWDASTPSPYYFRGYGRKYTDGSGWAGLGPNFAQIASDSRSLYSAVSLFAGPGGLYMANFLDGTGSSAASVSNSGNGWQQYNNSSGVTSPAAGTQMTSVMDSLGRGYVFYNDGLTLRERHWALASPTGLSSTANDASGIALATTSAITARFDGVSQVCASYETSGNALQVSCENVGCSGTHVFGTHTTIDTDVWGHDTTTDGAGNILITYYKGGALWASRGSQSGTCASGGTETWSTPVQIDVKTTGYTSDSYGTPTISEASAWPQGARPGVVYVGDGRYLAIWIGVNTGVKATRIYSVLYDPALGGWQAPSDPMTLNSQYSQDYYTTYAHPQSLTAFANVYGNAGFAINEIVTTDTTSSSGSSIYPELAQVRSIAVNRWQKDVGWVGLISFAPVIENGLATTPGTTCFNLLNGATAVTDSGAGVDCAHPPVGLILPSGTSLVLFQAQDGFPQAGTGGTIPGNRRLSVTEFR